MYRANISKILEAKRFFVNNPQGTLYLGFNFGYWDAQKFKAWFISCLLVKCGGKVLTTHDIALKNDYRKVQDYKSGQRHSGRNLLTTKLFKQLYPQVDNQLNEVN
jgi:hypothetical protein